MKDNEKLKTDVKEEKLKVLMPSLKLKKRFIKAQIECSKKLDFKEVSDPLIQEISFYLGVIETSKNGLWVLKERFDYENQIVYIKCSAKIKDKVVGVLSLIQKIGNNDVRIKTLKVSGTLKGLQ